MDGHVPPPSDVAWHPGEVAIQKSAGVADLMAPIAQKVIRDHLIEQHRAFFAKLSFVIAGRVDDRGDAWATILAGAPGFLQSPDPGCLRVTLPVSPADPAAGLKDGDALGLLGIELPTRRRNRLNGRIRRVTETVFDVVVSQSYGNCPQYIRQRQYHFVRDPMRLDDNNVEELDHLDRHCRSMIEKAETFFIASYVDLPDGRRHVDVSHKGGRPGFVRIGADGGLTIPDFAGNLYFNTLGNILLNPKCGLVFIDFENGDVLHIAGDGAVILDSPEIAAFQGAERLLRVTPRRIVFRAGTLPLRWSSPAEGISGNTLLTGTWSEAASRLQAAAVAAAWRPFRVAKIVDESSVVRSLHLLPTDGAGLVPHRAGQHLTIRVRQGAEDDTTRSYTVSSAPSDGIYRISVKRDGAVSESLHALMVGDTIEVRAPSGRFTIDLGTPRPIVMLAGGIGVTPLLAMLRHVVYEGQRTRNFHPTWFVYAARTKAERAFDREIAALVAASGKAVALTRALSDVSNAGPVDFEVAGRVTMDLLRDVARLNDLDFYICGPASFTQDLYDGLRAAGVPDKQIFTEAFGIAALQRTNEGTRMSRAPARQPVEVTFSASQSCAQWTPEAGTLLEFAEAQGLAPSFDCRRGTCGSCSTRILAGAVAYRTRPSVPLEDDEVLICCAVPSETDMSDGGLVLAL